MNTDSPMFSELYDLAEVLATKNKIIFDAFNNGMKQKEIAGVLGLSESRIKAICAEQRKGK